MSERGKIMNWGLCTKSYRKWTRLLATWSLCNWISQGLHLLAKLQLISSQEGRVLAKRPQRTTQAHQHLRNSSAKYFNRTISTWNGLSRSKLKVLFKRQPRIHLRDITHRHRWKEGWTLTYQRTRCDNQYSSLNCSTSFRTLKANFRTWTWPIWKMSN